MGIAYNFPTGQVFQQFSQNTYTGLLATGVEQTLTVPGISVMGRSTTGGQNKTIAVITVNTTSSIWVAVNQTVAVPVTTLSLLPGELIPQKGEMIKQVTIGDVLHFITSGNNIQIGVAFYQSL